MTDVPLVAAGREVPDALNSIRRYCGLPWLGGSPETWAWHYYDAVTSDPDELVTATDVLCAAALHPGLARTDLAFFRERAADVSGWLATIPSDARLTDAPEAVVEDLIRLPHALPGPSITLLSKVLHRKRPHLIPLLDRHVIDWYRPLTGRRAAGEAWEAVVRAMRSDVADDERRLINAIALSSLEQALWPQHDADDRPKMSVIRALDIAIWMQRR